MKLSAWFLAAGLLPGVLACRTTDVEHRRRFVPHEQDLAPIEPSPMTPEEKQLYATGCKQSVSECFNSCPSHKYLAERNFAVCPESDDGLMQWICYCKN